MNKNFIKKAVLVPWIFLMLIAFEQKVIADPNQTKTDWPTIPKTNPCIDDPGNPNKECMTAEEYEELRKEFEKFIEIQREIERKKDPPKTEPSPIPKTEPSPIPKTDSPLPQPKTDPSPIPKTDSPLPQPKTDPSPIPKTDPPLPQPKTDPFYCSAELPPPERIECLKTLEERRKALERLERWRNMPLPIPKTDPPLPQPKTDPPFPQPKPDPPEKQPGKKTQPDIKKLLFPFLPEFGRIFTEKLIPELAEHFGVLEPIANHFLQKLFTIGYNKIAAEVNKTLGKAGLPDLKELEEIWGYIPIQELSPIATAIFDNNKDPTGTIARQFTTNNAIANLGFAIADSTVLSKKAQEKNVKTIALALKSFENSLKIAKEAESKKISQEIIKDLTVVTAEGRLFNLIEVIQNEEMKNLLAGNTKNLATLLEEITRQRAYQLKEDNATNKFASEQIKIVLPLLMIPQEEKK